MRPKPKNLTRALAITGAIFLTLSTAAVAAAVNLGVMDRGGKGGPGTFATVATVPPTSAAAATTKPPTVTTMLPPLTVVVTKVVRVPAAARSSDVATVGQAPDDSQVDISADPPSDLVVDAPEPVVTDSPVVDPVGDATTNPAAVDTVLTAPGISDEHGSEPEHSTETEVEKPETHTEDAPTTTTVNAGGTVTLTTEKHDVESDD